MTPPDDIVAPSLRGQPTGPDSDGLARRRFLRLAGGAVIGGVAVSVFNACSSSGQTSTSGSTKAVAIDGTLTVPALLVPETQDGQKVFRLALQRGESTFLPNQTTTTYGFNGDYLGPTLRAKNGDRVLIHVTNHLGENTTVHWHGMHLPAAMDGGPMQTVADAATWSPHFTIQQPAATLWYHPHLMGETLQQVGMGLAGLFILDDSEPAPDGLPSTYGVDDLPLILQAQTFGADGQFVLNGQGRGGRGGGGGGQGTTLVNGEVSPAINTSEPRLRLRLLNASSEEIYNLGLAGGQTFHQVASDGGLLSAPVPLTTLQLAPAERAEVVVDVDPSGPTVLQSIGGNGGGRGGGNNAPTGALLTVNPTNQSSAPAALPASLATIEPLSPESATQTRDFVLGGNDQDPTINGQAMTTMADLMDMSNVIQVKLGATEIWNLINRSNDTHAFHVHDIQFQVLQRDGTAPAANESGLKDTVVVRPAETVQLIMRFTDFADPDTPYMYHCHLLNHEDNGMMGQFVVV
ncbi:MAG: cell division protein SufI [Ilumatobacteraceae bacterium]|nr:cell division protein SufI [Ilumatobacteraceae bacterium]